MKRRIRLAWACYNRFKRELYDMEDAPFTLKVRMPKAEVMETLLHECVTWTLGQEHSSLSSERHTTTSSFGSLASSADNALTTSCRTPRLSRRHNARALRRPSANDASSLRGRTTDDQRAADPSGDVWDVGWWGEPRTRPTRRELGPKSSRRHQGIPSDRGVDG